MEVSSSDTEKLYHIPGERDPLAKQGIRNSVFAKTIRWFIEEEGDYTIPFDFRKNLGRVVSTLFILAPLCQLPIPDSSLLSRTITKILLKFEYQKNLLIGVLSEMICVGTVGVACWVAQKAISTIFPSGYKIDEEGIENEFYSRIAKAHDSLLKNNRSLLIKDKRVGRVGEPHWLTLDGVALAFRHSRSEI